MVYGEALAKNNEHKVGIAQHKACRPPDRVVTLGLGSCVGIVLLDRVSGIGGMIHIMLPDSTQFSKVTNQAKYADTGIPLLLQEVLSMGARRKNLHVKMAGGSQMFKSHAGSSLLNIGERNIDKTYQVLQNLGLKITGKDVGGSVGRTLILDCSVKKVFVRTIGSSPREI